MKPEPIIAVLHDWGSVSSDVEHMGGVPLSISTREDLDAVLPHLDGIILTGGGDVNPYAYAKERHNKVYGVDNKRDALEFYAVRQARKRRIPMFGICRGMQLLNVAHGGTLTQHIFDSAQTRPHEGVEHVMRLRRKTKVADFLRVVELDGQCIHHQAVDRMGHGLLPVAWTEDGIVHMLESAPGVRPYVLATQFHPEMAQYHEDANRIILSFIAYLKARISHANFKAKYEQVKEHLYWRASSSSLYGYDYRTSRTTHTTQRHGYGGSFEGSGMFDDDWDHDWPRRDGRFDPIDTVDRLMERHESNLMLATSSIERKLLDHEGTIIVGVDQRGLEYCNDPECCPGGLRFYVDADTQLELNEVCVGAECLNPADCLQYGDCQIAAVQAQTAKKVDNVLDIGHYKRGNPRKGHA